VTGGCKPDVLLSGVLLGTCTRNPNVTVIRIPYLALTPIVRSPTLALTQTLTRTLLNLILTLPSPLPAGA